MLRASSRCWLNEWITGRCSLSCPQRIQLVAEAHKEQKRKTGEPYIIHPIAVARIVAEELELGVNPVMAAFLHDVVEDTQYTIEDIRERFGEDVAFLVGVVTKQKKEKYDKSKQVDIYRQILASVQYDVRAILVKLADRLHNMRTLAIYRLRRVLMMVIFPRRLKNVIPTTFLENPDARSA